MAYIGGWSAILQTPEPGEGNFHITGKAAWLLWRSAYLAKSKASQVQLSIDGEGEELNPFRLALSIRNKILVAYFCRCLAWSDVFIFSWGTSLIDFALGFFNWAFSRSMSQY